jgi:hypothetical protein
VAAPNTLKLGDRIKVKGWPGTTGQRFTVSRVDGDNVHAWDDDKKHRVFPLSKCTKDGRVLA